MYGILVAVCVVNTISGLSPQVPASYRIEASLDTISQKIYGAETVKFLNPTANSLDKICFHLYPNAFSDTNSVFCRENDRVRRDVAAGNISGLTVSEITLFDKTVDTSRVSLDGTLMYISLPMGLPPGREVEISMKFELVIPRARVRFGHNGNGDYMISHWYPILCGYQKGRLIDEEYHSNSEFFSNFGYYDVTMNLPPNFIVGSTGLLNLEEKSDSLAVWKATADTVIDFAFACGRNFQQYQSNTSGITIDYLVLKQNASVHSSIDSAVTLAIGYCSDRLFPYPYSNFTVVDFDIGSAGLELPGLIVADISGGDMAPLSSVKSLLAHEVVHQWFYAAIATNETDEPWLDEGLTSYFTSNIQRENPGMADEITIFGYTINYDIISRIFTLMRGASYPIDLPSYDYPDWLEYQMAVYYRADMVLQCLERVVGDSVFAAAIRDYASEFRFKHPDTKDLQILLSQSTGADLSEFYSQFISGTARVDYGITSLNYTENRGLSDSDKKYIVTVDLRRERHGVLPQIVSLCLENGTIVDTTWDGRSRVAEFEFMTSSVPVYAAIDQYGVYPIDEMYSNNRLYIKSQSSRMISFDWDLIFAVESLLSLML